MIETKETIFYQVIILYEQIIFFKKYQDFIIEHY